MGKVSDLTEMSTLAESDDLYVVDDVLSRRITALNLGNTLPVKATGSTTARALAARFSDVINVKDYGATGDGVTDDTAAIQAAHDAAVAAGGGVVAFPQGAYKCDTGLAIDDDVPILWMGLGGGAESGMGARLDFSGLPSGAAITVEKSSDQVRGFSMRNLAIERSTLASKGSGLIGLKMRAAKFFDFVSVTIDNFDINLDLDDNSSDACFRGRFSLCRFLSAATGVARLGGVIETNFLDCQFGGVGGSGGHDYDCRITGGAVSKQPNGNYFLNCVFIDTGTTKPTHCLNQVDGFFNNFVNCAFERATSANVQVDYPSLAANSRPSATFTSCWTDNADARCLVINNAHVRSLGSRWVHGGTGETIRITCSSKSQTNTSLIGDYVEYGAVRGVFIDSAIGVRVFGCHIKGDGANPGVVLGTNTEKCAVFHNDHNNTTGLLDISTAKNNLIAEDDYLGLENWPKFIVKRYTGTADGSGVANFAHSIAGGNKRLLWGNCYYQGGSGESLAMAFGYCDGGNAQFTGATASAAYRATLVFATDAAGW